ncbi:MAG: neutral zinc metallopeptidase [Halioglobus sp.]|nr:neutral zinc metallopeptidase [Halioglobus sp.]
MPPAGYPRPSSLPWRGLGCRQTYRVNPAPESTSAHRSAAARRQVVPDRFTHGSSQQRVRWFRARFESRDLDACATFSAVRL